MQKCKKIRKMYVRKNENILGDKILPENKICWICIIREKIPNWRPTKIIK